MTNESDWTTVTTGDEGQPTAFPKQANATSDGQVDEFAINSLHVPDPVIAKRTKEKKNRIAVARGLLLLVGAAGIVIGGISFRASQLFIESEIRTMGNEPSVDREAALLAAQSERAQAHVWLTLAICEGAVFLVLGFVAKRFPYECFSMGMLLYLVDSLVSVGINPGVFPIIRILIFAGLYRGWRAAAVTTAAAADS